MVTVAARAVTDRQTDTKGNPHACAPRVKNSGVSQAILPDVKQEIVVGPP